MVQIELLLTALALAGLSILFGASMYDALVLAPNMRGGPDVLEHGRLFMSRATPANLFRIASPATQVLLVLTLIATWHIEQCRWLVGAALLALVLADVITFRFHYPRNHLMFDAPTTIDANVLDTAARQWAAGNMVRVALVVFGWFCALLAVSMVVLVAYP
ncbi:MAG TPA: hypothetical protein VF166_00210 [Gemmatimonadaceae bacterium]